MTSLFNMAASSDDLLANTRLSVSESVVLDQWPTILSCTDVRLRGEGGEGGEEGGPRREGGGGEGGEERGREERGERRGEGEEGGRERRGEGGRKGGGEEERGEGGRGGEGGGIQVYCNSVIYNR